MAGGTATVEAALRQLRVLAGALLLLHFATLEPGSAGAALPLPPLAVGVALAASMAGVNLLSLVARRAPRVAGALGAAEVAVDAGLVLLVVCVLEVGPEALVWVALVVPVLEGVLRYRMRGAVVTWAGLCAAYLLIEVGLPQVAEGTDAQGAFLVSLQMAVHRLAVVLLVAVPGGYLSEQLVADIDVQRRATQEANRRSGLLHRVAEAGERVTQLDEQVLDAVLECVALLGFPAAHVSRRAAGGGWTVDAALTLGIGLPTPDALPAAADLALDRRATAIVEDDDRATGDERAVLRAFGLRAVVLTPLVRRDGVPMLLCAGLRTGPLPAAQVEALELLAGQAGTALRNGLLVDQLREVQAKLEYQAFHDALTSLANRARFLLRLEEAVVGMAASGTRSAVLFCDLDRFKPVNDSYGHDVGNELLRAVGGRLLAAVRESDLVARLGGDEFAVLVQPVQGPEPEQIAERIVAALSVPFTPGGHEVVVGTSVGIALLDTPGVESGELLRRADVAMYHAKQTGRGRWRHHRPELDEAARDRVRLEADLRHAIERGELSLAYQPIVELATERVRGFEALVRWTHPVLGAQHPERFISLAEESGSIIDLGRWVLREACGRLAQLQAQAPGDLVMAVNVSPRQLQHLGFPAELDALLDTSGIDPAGLLLEITERVVTLPGCEDLLDALRRRGVRLGLDDFGQGQTSLRHLRRFPLDVLKVDRSILHGATFDARDRVVLRSIVELATDLGLAVIAEGVETAEHVALLEALGCQMAQGFHLARPLDAPELAALAAGVPSRTG